MFEDRVSLGRAHYMTMSVIKYYTVAMTDYMFIDRMLRIAKAQSRLAQHATSNRERAHYELESERFEELAEMARADSAAARCAYRPSRTFEPEPVA